MAEWFGGDLGYKHNHICAAQLVSQFQHLLADVFLAFEQLRNLLFLLFDQLVKFPEIAVDPLLDVADVGTELFAYLRLQPLATLIDFGAVAPDDFTSVDADGYPGKDQSEGGEDAAGDVEYGEVGQSREQGADYGDATSGRQIGSDAVALGKKLFVGKAIRAFEKIGKRFL